tara:strand:+ start:114 stop:746 length:633 start_codon:yes stop_codon:yes gene_type:complete
MKRLSFILLILFGTTLYAQDFEGVIEVEITYEDLSVEMKPYASMLPSSSITYIKGNISKMVLPNMGGETTTISDSETGETITLQDAMGNKIAIRTNLNDVEEDDIPEIEYSEETKEILGYKCKKAYFESEGAEMTIYYTEELPNLVSKAQLKQIKGYPMESILVTEQFTQISKVKSIKEEKVKKIKMEVPADFKEMTLEEIQKMQSGAGM